MAERFDAVILGAGPGGEVALNTLVKAGRRVALVEKEVIGGECSNWGCIPSKTLLRPTELEGKCERAAGVDTPALDFERLAAYRDYMVSNHDDSKRIARHEERGVTLVQGPPRLADREEPQIGDLLAEILEENGVELRLGRRAMSVRLENGERWPRSTTRARREGPCSSSPPAAGRAPRGSTSPARRSIPTSIARPYCPHPMCGAQSWLPGRREPRRAAS